MLCFLGSYLLGRAGVGDSLFLPPPPTLGFGLLKLGQDSSEGLISVPGTRAGKTHKKLGLSSLLPSISYMVAKGS